MLAINEGTWDRALRIMVGLVLLYLGLGGVVTGAAGTALAILAVLPLLTGVIGWCPLYALLGISTSGRKTGGDALHGR
jgi:hypothetical protein